MKHKNGKINSFSFKHNKEIRIIYNMIDHLVKIYQNKNIKN